MLELVSSTAFSCSRSDPLVAWINSSNQSYMWELAQQFELETVVQNTEGKVTTLHEGSYQTVPYGEVLKVSRPCTERLALTDLHRIPNMLKT